MKQKVKLLSSYNIESLKYLLEKYIFFKQYVRDIKIESLYGKRSQFDVTEIKPQILAGFSDRTIIYQNTKDTKNNLSESIIAISDISIIFESDTTISEIVVKFDVINEQFVGLFTSNMVDIIVKGNPNIHGFAIELSR